MTKSKMNVGDIIQFPVGERKVALAHVVADFRHPGYHYLLFYGPFEYTPTDLHTVPKRKPVLIGLTMDSRIRSGDWQIIGSIPVEGNRHLPAYQISIGSIDDVYVEDYTGTQRRPATSQERKIVPHREFLSPMILEKAMRSLAGLEPWLEAFDSLRPNEETSTRCLFGSQ